MEAFKGQLMLFDIVIGALVTRDTMLTATPGFIPLFISSGPFGTEEDVRGVLLNHEDVWGGRKSKESLMDQHNNEIGISIGSGVKCTF